MLLLIVEIIQNFHMLQSLSHVTSVNFLIEGRAYDVNYHFVFVMRLQEPVIFYYLTLNN